MGTDSGGATGGDALGEPGSGPGPGASGRPSPANDPDRVPAATLTIPGAGVTLTADAYGDPAAPTVFLLHGGGQTRHSWGTTAAALARAGWYGITVDLRGHGDSGWSPDRTYPLSSFAADVAALARWDGGRPVLVGASLGGIAALTAIGQDPDLAAALVLVDVSPFLQPAGTTRIHDFMTAHPEGYGSLAEAAEAVAAYLPHRPRPRSTDGLRKNLRERDGRWFWHWDPGFMRGASAESGPGDQVLDPDRLVGAAASLRIPTLLVRGGESDVLSADDARRFLELVPHAEYLDVAGAHHMVAGDDNAVFDRTIGEFLARRVRPRLALGV